MCCFSSVALANAFSHSVHGWGLDINNLIKINTFGNKDLVFHIAFLVKRSVFLFDIRDKIRENRDWLVQL